MTALPRIQQAGKAAFTLVLLAVVFAVLTFN
jgi:hypothetical protein